ncbi:MAG: TonB-dependent receptor plug domain-containing protein [Spirochaetota bacterium]
MKKLSVQIFVMCICFMVFAQVLAFDIEDATDSESGSASEQIVVTGTKTEKLKDDAPVKTEVLTSEEIEAKGAENLFYALNGELGAVVENNCQNCAANTISLNGLGGNYTQILVNGRPVVSSLSGVYFLQQIPVSAVDRVEIVRGGGSALYGSGAVGGVVNVIMKKPVAGGASIGYRYGFLETPDSPVWSVDADATHVSRDGKAGVIVYANKGGQDHWDANGDDYSDLPALNSQSGGANGFVSLTDSMELEYSLFAAQEHRRGGNRFHVVPEKTDICEQVDTNRSSGDITFRHRASDLLDYSVYYAFALTDRETYYGPGSPSPETDTELAENLQYNGKTDNDFHVVGTDVHMHFGREHLVTAGGSYSSDFVADENLGIDRETENTYTNIGVFGQYNYVGSFFEVLAGIRGDKHSELDSMVFSPRASGIVKFTPDLRWRSSVSTGFLAPQVFDEDYHIEVGLAGDSSTQHVIENADDLKEERSISFSSDVGYDLELGSFDFDANVGGFYTSITDAMYVDYDNVETRGTSNYYYRKNADGETSVYGATTELMVSYTSLAVLSHAMTWQQADMPDSGDEYMNKMPDFNSNTMLQFFYDALELDLSAQYIGTSHVFKEDEGDAGEFVETDSFIVLGARLAYTYAHEGRNVSFYGGVNNITNAYQDDVGKGTDRPAGYMYGPVRPRTVYTGCVYSF